ncbi:MAG: hypothetical protein GF393_00585 [Armatimonadia bacterium]|nr:hypothetical protein [Armatimonadia bacterium]
MTGEAAAKEPMPLGAKLWLAGFVVMFALAGAAYLAIPHMPKTIAMTSVEGIERLSGIILPPQTRIINARYSAPAMSQGRIAWAVLEMPRDAAIQFMRSEAFGDTFTRDERMLESPYGDAGDFFGERIEAWEPAQAEEVASASTVDIGVADDAWGAMAQADLDDPHTATVYLLMQR